MLLVRNECLNEYVVDDIQLCVLVRGDGTSCTRTCITRHGGEARAGRLAMRAALADAKQDEPPMDTSPPL